MSERCLRSPSLACLKIVQRSLTASSTLKSSAGGSIVMTLPMEKLLTINLGTILQRSSQLSHETTPARTALVKKNNPEQCPKTLFQPKQLLKVPEQESGFTVEQ
jgi:hypothetical protein